jgi:hypothetical protein
MNRKVDIMTARALIGAILAVAAMQAAPRALLAQQSDPLTQAAREYRFEIRPTIGVVFPLDPDGLGTGWDIGASVRAMPPAWPIGVQLDFIVIDLEGSLFQFAANAVYQFSSSSSLRPYLIGGLGLYDGDFGVNAGVGLDFAVTGAPIGFFAEGRFHRVFGDPSDLSLFPLNGGVRIRF